MKILVLGGTKFVGRHLVKLALAAGHNVTTFNRGRSAALNEEGLAVHKLIGDRSSDLKALSKGEWDVVYDLSGYLPEEVQATVELLSARVSRYIFVSSISVYCDSTTSSVRENAAVYGEGEGYGQLKALCERKVLDLLGPDKGVVVRPGLIVGPYDPTFRFNYWIERVSRGGAILAPGRPDRKIQVIDARDLSLFMLSLAAAGNNSDVEQSVASTDQSIFNAAGEGDLTFGQLLAAIEKIVRSDNAAEAKGAQIVWVSDQELINRSVCQWTELPLWIAEEGESASFYRIDSSKAVLHGLTYLPIEETIEAICQYHPQLLQPGFRLAEGAGAGDPRLMPTFNPSLEEAILADIGLTN